MICKSEGITPSRDQNSFAMTPSQKNASSFYYSYNRIASKPSVYPAPSQQKMRGNDSVLTLPIGHLGVHFSDTVPCEISRVDHESPIFDSSLQLIGCLAFQLSIPNKIDISGEIDNVRLQTLLSMYSNIPDRKLVFRHMGQDSQPGLTTTTVLPKGPIDASFRRSYGFYPNRQRVFVTQAGSELGKDFEFPIGHYVEKVIIPNQIMLEGGVRSPEFLLETLNYFSEVPNRRIVFQSNIPQDNPTMKIILPSGSTGLVFSVDNERTGGKPLVSMVIEGSSAYRLNVPLNYVVEKVIVPNDITIERMGRVNVEKIFNACSEAESRIVVLQEFRRDMTRYASRLGAKVTITLPTGRLGIVVQSQGDALWISEVKADSQVVQKVPPDYCVESFTIPGELELIGTEELRNASYLSAKLKDTSNIPGRILVLQQFKKDLEVRAGGTQLNFELV